LESADWTVALVNVDDFVNDAEEFLQKAIVYFSRDEHSFRVTEKRENEGFLCGTELEGAQVRGASYS